MEEIRQLPNSKALLKITPTSRKIILPDISDEELLERYSRIKPIFFDKELNEYYFLENQRLKYLKHCSFIWEPVYKGKVDTTKMEELRTFTCYHGYGYYGIFKPSIAEVLAQFPDDLLDVANAFYLAESPDTLEDLNRQMDVINAGCHESKVKAIRLK